MALQVTHHDFEILMAPHLGTGYTLTRYLLRNEADADDVFQEALLKAFRFFENGRDLRPWFLQIVRNCAYTWLRRGNKYRELAETELLAIADPQPGAETQLMAEITAAAVQNVLLQLPPEFQEVLVLREIENLPYSEIAAIVGIPEGTVMSRLARARKKFRDAYTAAEKGNPNEY